MARTARTRNPKPIADGVSILDEIARNLWWSWNPDATALFEYAGSGAFAACGNNPIVMLRKLSARRRRELTADVAFMAEAERVRDRLRAYLRDATWFAGKYGRKVKGLTAYFCMEYALHESLPLYAGGLGVLAGDHVKSASDLGLPFVAVGIYWHRGYTRQRIDKLGRQQDVFPPLQLGDAPFKEIMTRGGKPLRVKVPLGDETIVAGAWRVDVGRVPIYLLDTNLPENPARHRKLVDVLYSGDRDMRIRQEILLGIGGWRLLRAMKVPVAACHLNEGHAAFLNLERTAERMEQKHEKLARAMKYVTNTSVFTTHTPVPAGNEEFAPALVDRYLGAYVGKLGLTHEAFHDLARVRPGNTKENYGLTPLALHTSRYCNGVAALHGKVARKMWKPLYRNPAYRGRMLTAVPIGHVTNGIHLRTWLHPEMGDLLDEALGENWEVRQDQASLWKRAVSIPDEALWDVHEACKRELIHFCRGRLAEQWRRNRPSGLKTTDVEEVLDPRALTIGFARRFATYKRATLVFSDQKRLARILNDAKRPVQIIFAGKAHPADAEGKAFIQEVARLSRMPKFCRRVVFIEDYEMEVARYMVAGVDVWLNTPHRPREASGTSGMKPALHGGLNLSILDGWWPEACNGRNGWAIGRGQDHDGTPAADRRDAADLYRVLDSQVVPLYYQRATDGLPKKWLAHMKNALATIPPFFNTHRQVKEYLKKYYLPAMRKA